MALNVPAGMYVAKLLWRMDGDAETMISTLGLRAPDGPGDTLVDVAESVAAAWVGAWDEVTLNPSYVFVGVDILTPATGGSDVATYIWPNGRGTQGNNCLPNNCALLVKKNTGQGGRRNRGRMFLPAGYLPNSEVNHAGVVAGGWLNSCQGYMDQFYANLTDGTTPPGNIQIELQPVLFHNSPANAPTDITQFIVDNRIATQRSRLR